MLFGLNARDRKLFDLVRINVTTGDSEPAFQNPGFQQVYTAPDFLVRLGRRFLPDGSAEIQQWDPDGTWRSFLTIGVDDVFTTWPDRVSPDGRSVFMIDSRGRNTAALVEIDCQTGESQVLAEDSEADIVEAAYDPDSGRPYAAAAFATRKLWHRIDPAYGFDLDHLQAAQGAGEFAIVSQSNQRDRVAAYYYRSDAAGEFRLYDRKKQSLLPLFKDRTDLDTIALQPMQPVAIRASDGVMLPSYLTLPTASARNIPMVLAIHGGPYWRDKWGLSGLHQWLASRGYAVLSVNYRGSSGFGKHFIQIADQGWGGRMQDDLTDAAAWAVAEGYADPRRLGFFGASYGGYAALTAATKTPETFACIVDLFGPANLVTLMRSIPSYWHTWFSTWKRRLADPTTQAGRQWLIARSPLTHVGQIVRPLLIGQGLRDVRVTPDESATIVQAMQARDIPVTYVTFPDEGHGFARQENRIAFCAVMEAFFAQHLGGRAEAVGDAFSGSTIQFEAGRSLISGIG
jgi:dienelactone hydrolase